MKASQLVIKLSELIERHGDKEVEVYDDIKDLQVRIKDVVNTDNPRLFGEVFLMTVL